MAKKTNVAPGVVTLMAPGIETIAGSVTEGDNGVLITYKPPRVSKLETRFIPYNVVVEYVAGESDDGAFVSFNGMIEIAGSSCVDINALHDQVDEQGFLSVEDEDDKVVVINTRLAGTIFSAQSERFDAPGATPKAAKEEKAPAKKGGKKPVEEEVEDEVEEKAPAKKPKKADKEEKAPAKKGGKKPAKDEDEDDDWG